MEMPLAASALSQARYAWRYMRGLPTMNAPPEAHQYMRHTHTGHDPACGCDGITYSLHVHIVAAAKAWHTFSIPLYGI